MSAGLVLCICPDPDCRAIAEVVETWWVDGAPGPVEHVATYCFAGHAWRLPADWVTLLE